MMKLIQSRERSRTRVVQLSTETQSEYISVISEVSPLSFCCTSWIRTCCWGRRGAGGPGGPWGPGGPGGPGRPCCKDTHSDKYSSFCWLRYFNTDTTNTRHPIWISPPVLTQQSKTQRCRFTIIREVKLQSLTIKELEPDSSG